MRIWRWLVRQDPNWQGRLLVDPTQTGRAARDKLDGIMAGIGALLIHADMGPERFGDHVSGGASPRAEGGW